MPFKDLREFIGLLEEKKDLLRVKKSVDVKHEIAAFIRKTSDSQGRENPGRDPSHCFPP